MFGSDSTYLSPGAQLSVVGFAEISDADKEKILARNARRVFGKRLP
jgi:predicted TIM-barrel fold metal-dependent hydrolase